MSGSVAAIEYYDAGFDHYFISSNSDEIAKLDNGTFVGWARTGQSFNVYANATPGANSVCRFFSTAFDPKSSHFYTPFADECATVKMNPAWQFEGEGDQVFYIPVASDTGSCAAGTIPVYRVYNNGMGNAPNHRYTTSAATRDQMVSAGWVTEGNGPGFAFMCSPMWTAFCCGARLNGPDSAGSWPGKHIGGRVVGSRSPAVQPAERIRCPSNWRLRRSSS